MSDTHEWDCLCEPCLAKDAAFGDEAEATNGRTGSLMAVRLGNVAAALSLERKRVAALTEAFNAMSTAFHVYAPDEYEQFTAALKAKGVLHDSPGKVLTASVKR
jgi:hypothetical protein